MASFELISAVQDYEKYIEKNGINEQVIDVYCEAVNTAFANEKDIAYVYQILKEGSEKAEAVAAQTLSEVKAAMKINYFDDAELINSQIKKYSEK